ncbi:MAG: ribosome silencing factor [Clostridia bacterium]|nr:ribosome silencing factor [Clostridia bacterium]
MDERTLALRAAQILYDKKALDIMALDVSHMTVITDYMVICTGRSAQQVHALCEDVEDALAAEGVLVRKKEGHNEGRWAILDYGNLLVHIFHPEERQYYRLERLWDEGTNRLELPFDQDAEARPFLP